MRYQRVRAPKWRAKMMASRYLPSLQSAIMPVLARARRAAISHLRVASRALEIKIDELRLDGSSMRSISASGVVPRLSARQKQKASLRLAVSSTLSR